MTFDSTQSLPALLEIMDSVDQGIIDLPNEELAIIGSQARDKVDQLYRFFDAIDTRRSQLQEMILKLKALDSALGKRKDSAEQYIASTMDERGFKQFPGFDFEAKVTESIAVETEKNVKFTEEFLTAWQPFIRTKTVHEFDKVGLKKELQEGTAFPFAKLRRNLHLNFGLKRKELK